MPTSLTGCAFPCIGPVADAQSWLHCKLVAGFTCSRITCLLTLHRDLRKNHGKEEARARDLFYALWIPDEFMRRVEVCPRVAVLLNDIRACCQLSVSGMAATSLLLLEKNDDFHMCAGER